jgi:hypothetical protein
MIASAADGCKPMLGCLVNLDPKVFVVVTTAISTGFHTERRHAMATRVFVAALWIVVAAVAQAVDVSGTWAVTITTASGTISGKASLKQAGDRVTGQIGPSADPTIPIEGGLSGTKLTLKTNPQRGRTAAFESCELTVGDDKMVGTIEGGDVGSGRIEFVRMKP